MGGSGSGNFVHWWRGRKKDTVEDCRRLDANRWMREGILRAGVWHRGGWSWYRDATLKESVAGIGYEVNTTEAGPWVRLFYTFTRSGEQLDYLIPLATTRPRFGGLRWWFLCPLSGCGRRVGKLYLPPGGRYFGCRRCHALTYASCQERNSHRTNRVARSIAGDIGADFLSVRSIMRELGKPRDSG